MAAEELFHKIQTNDEDVTFTGGDPIYQARALVPLLRMLKDAGRDIWLYTGYTFQELASGKAGDHVLEALEYIDTLVDGPFIKNLRDHRLLFRGSSNQRIIDVPRSLATGKTIERKEYRLADDMIL